MKNLLLLFFLLCNAVVFTQSKLTIFNNSGELFYIIMNGIKQNAVPQTSVSVSGIEKGTYAIKLIFADGKKTDIDKKFYLDENSVISAGVIFKKGKGKLQITNMETASSQPVVVSDVHFRHDSNTFCSDDPEHFPVSHISPGIPSTPRVFCSQFFADTAGVVERLKSLKFSDDQKKFVYSYFNKMSLNSDQLIQVLREFTFETDRLEVAKFLTDRLLNYDNSGLIYQEFKFDSSRTELRQYMYRD